MTRNLPIAPLTRGECAAWTLPCRLTRCRYHLDHDTRKGGRHTLKPLRRRAVHENCSLNVADAGPHTFAEIAEVTGLTRERMRQVEDGALRKLRNAEQAIARLLREMDE